MESRRVPSSGRRFWRKTAAYLAPALMPVSVDVRDGVAKHFAGHRLTPIIVARLEQRLSARIMSNAVPTEGYRVGYGRSPCCEAGRRPFFSEIAEKKRLERPLRAALHTRPWSDTWRLCCTQLLDGGQGCDEEATFSVAQFGRQRRLCMPSSAYVATGFGH